MSVRRAVRQSLVLASLHRVRRSSWIHSTVVAGAVALGGGAALAEPADGGSRTVVLEEVVVTGSQIRLPESYAGGQVARGGRAGILGNLDIMETPFSSTNFTAALIENQQAKSVADVLLNDPVVRAAQGFGNAQEVYIIRGLPAFSDDMTYNGIFGILPRQFVAGEFMERVESFRGASAFLNGAAPGGSNLGGTINLVPKRATQDPLARVTLGFENDAALYGALDVGRRFGPDNATGVRANVARRDGETAVQDQDRKLTVLSLGLDHDSDQFRLSADIGYQDHHIDAFRPQVTPFGGIPDAPDADGNFAQPWTYTDEKQFFGVVRAEYDVNDAVSLWAAAGLRNGKERNVLANPSSLPDGSLTAYRFDNFRKDKVHSGEVGARFDFDTGPVGHRITVSGSLFSLDSKNAYAFSNFFAPFATDLYDPVDVAPPPADFFTGGSLTDPNKTFTTDTRSFAFADTLSLVDGKLLITAGARQQTLKGKTFDYNTGAELSSYDESRLTPVGAIVFRASQRLSVYASYVEGLIAGDTPPQVSGGLPVVNGGIARDPYRAKQVEAGVKYDGGNFGATLALFSIKRSFGILEPFDDPATVGDDLIYTDDGLQRNRGIELSFYGQPHERLRVLGGMTVLDAENVRTQSGLFAGKEAVGIPDFQANVNVEWDVPVAQGLTLDARMMYTSSQYADGGNTIEVPSWTRFDLGARYATQLAGKDVTFRARVNNLTGEDDWVSVGGFPGSNYLVLGAPRTFVLSVSVDLL